MNNRLCELLGIKYPIVQAPMGWIAAGELAGSVSRAGGLGCIGPNAGLTFASHDPEIVGQALLKEINRVRQITDKPFAVNLPIGRRGKNICDRRVEIAVEEKIKVAVVSMGSPDEYTPALKKAGIKVIHAVSSVKQAVKAEESGVDAVVVEGYEAGGHTGLDEIPLFVLIPQVADAVKIPVIAGGGIADARGLLASLALGAEGIYMGTRFMATFECAVHPAVKEAVVNATDTSTVAYGRKAYSMMRVIRNEFSDKYLEMEFHNAPLEELRNFDNYVGGSGGKHRLIAALIEGDLVNGTIGCGAGAGLVKSIVSAGDVVKQIMEEANKIRKNLV